MDKDNAKSLWWERTSSDVEWKPITKLECNHKAYLIGSAWYLVKDDGVLLTADYFVTCRRLPWWRGALVRLRLWMRSAWRGKP